MGGVEVEVEAAKTSSFCSTGFEIDVERKKLSKRFNLQLSVINQRPPGNEGTNLLHFSDEKYRVK